MSKTIAETIAHMMACNADHGSFDYGLDLRSASNPIAKRLKSAGINNDSSVYEAIEVLATETVALDAKGECGETIKIWRFPDGSEIADGLGGDDLRWGQVSPQLVENLKDEGPEYRDAAKAIAAYIACHHKATRLH